jgi:aminoglycoside 6'-N-acetyltransferase I
MLLAGVGLDAHGRGHDGAAGRVEGVVRWARADRSPGRFRASARVGRRHPDILLGADAGTRRHGDTMDEVVNVQLRLSSSADAYVIKNLWPLYQHDVSEFATDLVINRHGLFGVDDGVRSWDGHGDRNDAWWRAPRSLFPYLVVVDGRPAGFNLIATRPHLPEGMDADFTVHEFFVLHAHRGKGVAERAAIHGFDAHRGTWEIVTWPTHGRAIAFWRRVVGRYAANGFSEAEVDHPWGRRVAFRFDNGGGADASPFRSDPAPADG